MLGDNLLAFVNQKCRDALSVILQEHKAKFLPDRPIDVLVLGSPDANELNTMPEDLLSQMNVVSVDMKEGSRSFESLTYERIRGNVFEQNFLQDRVPHADVTLCKWFLHHCVSAQKDDLIQICADKLPENGLLVVMDWFVPDWDEGSATGFDTSCRQYFLYQEKLGLAPLKRRWVRNVIDVSTPNFHGGKFDSMRIFEERLMKNGLEFDELTLGADIEWIDDPELFGLHGYICRKRKQAVTAGE